MTIKLFCHEHGVIGAGPIPCQVMLVGISPGRTEMQTGKPFTGQSGNLLNNMLEACGWHRDKCYATNILCTMNDSPTLNDIIACRPRFQQEVALVKPKLIILLGAMPTGVFFPDRKFGEVRGNIDYYAPYDCWIMPTYHPAAILHSGDMSTNIASDIVVDFKKITMFFSDKPTLKAARGLNYHVINSVDEAQAALDALPLDTPVAVDVETDNVNSVLDEVDPQADNLLCLAISDGSPNVIVMPQSVVTPDLRWPDAQWTFQYGVFDTQVLMRRGIDLPIKHDSLLMHFALDERSGRHKLKPLARQYCYAGFYEASVAGVKANMRAADPDNLYKYNAYDAMYTARLIKRFEPMLREDDVDWQYENLLLPAINVFKYMQYYGVPVSRDKLLTLVREWIPLLQEKDANLRRIIIENGGPADLNLGSPQQLSKFIYGTLRLPRAPGGTATATGKDVLEALEGEHEFIEALVDDRHLAKMLNTYVFGILDSIKRTNRAHPSPSIHGTVGGRLAYSNPPINTIPRPYTQSPYAPKLRQIFAAEPGHVIVEMDYKQAELWMAWIYSRDPMLLSDLQTGDIHRQTAAFVLGCKPEEVPAYARSEAKPVNFGKLYFIGNEKLSKEINKTIQEAATWSRLWDQRYSVYVKWANDLFEEVKKTGEVTTFTHRKRRFPLVLGRGVLNQIINFPIQATSHDYILNSIIEAYWPLRRMGIELILDVHDAILLHAPENIWKEGAQYLKEVMSKQHFGLPPIPVETKLGLNWGELKEVEI